MGQEVWLDAQNVKTKAPSKLPAHMNIHPVFHVDLLIPYKVTAEYSIPFKCPAPKTIDGQEEYEVNEISAKRRHGCKHQCHTRLGAAVSVPCSSGLLCILCTGDQVC